MKKASNHFDKVVLQSESIRCSVELPNWKYADTLKMARTLLPNLKSHKEFYTSYAL